MSPGQNHRVEVAGALEGETVADAIRFVSAGTSAPGIYYVHADHLGSPQKMTDANQALVWDAVYTPFGQVHAITGTAINNQRFPGQYADAETGFNYNYFRDYDPTTGRYVQSDPIGLNGGNNAFLYSSGNPLRFFDPFGLIPWSPAKGAPNSNQSFPDGKGGHTERFYGPDGKATKDIDYGHDHGKGDPHVHDWDWSKDRPRQGAREIEPGEGQENNKFSCPEPSPGNPESPFSLINKFLKGFQPIIIFPWQIDMLNNQGADG